MVKYLLVLMLTAATSTISAQPNNAIRTVPKKSTKSNLEIGLVDNSKMYSSKYGQVARLTVDNMPCILPYVPKTQIPNGFNSGGWPPHKIPNAWQKDSTKKN